MIDGLTCDATHKAGCAKPAGDHLARIQPRRRRRQPVRDHGRPGDRHDLHRQPLGRRRTRHRLGHQRRHLQRPNHQRLRPDPRHRTRRIRRHRHHPRPHHQPDLRHQHRRHQRHHHQRQHLQRHHPQRLPQHPNPSHRRRLPKLHQPRPPDQHRLRRRQRRHLGHAAHPLTHTSSRRGGRRSHGPTRLWSPATRQPRLGRTSARSTLGRTCRGGCRSRWHNSAGLATEGVATRLRR